jgi:Cdc6-like AAA superfamily ATPase
MKTHSMLLSEDIIGREQEKSEIIRMLMESYENENVSVMFVVEVAGIGKTTVAKMVYNDNQIKMLFDVQIWISVGNFFSLNDIIIRILRSMDFQSNDQESLEDLIPILYRALTNRRYLLVLDDMWNENYGSWQKNYESWENQDNIVDSFQLLVNKPSSPPKSKKTACAVVSRR